MAERRLTLAAPEIPGTQTSAGIGPMRFHDAQCEGLLHDSRRAGATAGQRNPPARHRPARAQRIAGLQQVTMVKHASMANEKAADYRCATSSARFAIGTTPLPQPCQGFR
ncbi:hypothetical protein [Xanthomonas graminis]|jgi:hypothetical protein|uniref:hypothetical protein n=2 Tax=Xanthomonas graminis TaxID=3390026 RepID=UPI0011152FE3|nr:hypothetical protein [Xanthomonas translucens]UKE55159.1 hypothetical protein KFS84_04805 [Xanthomonas translucens pv. graminis]UKE66489.1 hypothetical protein KM547_04095 [Xanthomonas translucens pv. phlei]WIH09515.1 hypothetical protein KM579_05285 [Xanthomonas translucens pv. graminis]WIH12842.1 hypothetical protein KM563_03275 [Xanthomonas translucens pv. graminis]WIH15366.1 hypothetical protein KM433_16230 [Xanthomonas translucens pv. graminis]